jgi:hypothetical protein
MAEYIYETGYPARPPLSLGAKLLLGGLATVGGFRAWVGLRRALLAGAFNKAATKALSSASKREIIRGLKGAPAYKYWLAKKVGA